MYKALYIEGGRSSTTTMCSIHMDDGTAAILCQNAQNAPFYWWRGDSDKPIGISIYGDY